MQRWRLVWQLFITYILITIVALAAATWYAQHAFHDFHFNLLFESLEARARLIEPQIEPYMVPLDLAELEPLCERLGKQANARVTVVLYPGGTVVVDTTDGHARADVSANETELNTASQGLVGQAARYDQIFGEEGCFVAVPHIENGVVTYIVRTATTTAAIDRTLRGLVRRIGEGGAVIAALAALLSWLVSRRITRPLEEMRQVAERFAQGDFDRRLPMLNSEELGSLAESLNDMAAELDSRIRTVIEQRNQQDAVLRSMSEGVLAVDRDEYIITLNQTAARIFNVRLKEIVGRAMQEVLRNTQLHDFVERTLHIRGSLEDELILHDQAHPRYIKLQGLSLKDSLGASIGALVVMNEVTNLRTMEIVQRDFVANVSHELRTPITSIKGFAETLRDGALENADDAQRFLATILRQADRLNAIISDLLSLSSIEQEAEKGEVDRHRHGIAEVLAAAAQSCSTKAAEAGVEIHVACPPALEATINPQLIEQAVINLVDNAIKYSPGGEVVYVHAEDRGDRVAIHVADHGCGIPREHHTRLFERFYRVDKARSRKLGGTGLGLAIVQHIMRVHNGEIDLQSEADKGSTFTLLLTADAP